MKVMTRPIPAGFKVSRRVRGYQLWSALSTDVPALAELYWLAFPDRFKRPDQEWVRAMMGAGYCHGVQLATKDGRIVGALALRERFGQGETAWLAIHPEHERKGIGTMLVEAALEEFSALGTKRVYAVLNPPTAASLAFWKSAGFNHARKGQVA